MATLTQKVITGTTGFKITKVLSRSTGEVKEAGCPVKAVVALDNGTKQRVTQGVERIEVGDWVIGGTTHRTANEVALLYTVS